MRWTGRKLKAKRSRGRDRVAEDGQASIWMPCLQARPSIGWWAGGVVWSRSSLACTTGIEASGPTKERGGVTLWTNPNCGVDREVLRTQRGSFVLVVRCSVAGVAKSAQASARVRHREAAKQ